ncbi:CYFA0S41e00166g1_1 [Cyberlindnera fabianii]|uniref:Tyrosine--tRNA ligase n=1 Tax=Cyberlindnera fabianii TaxID=36022 RepID=A0A061BDG3_CYBFA|nr:CYFA0S41e00166g1_1 [Cyberlindnera fabianii]
MKAVWRASVLPVTHTLTRLSQRRCVGLWHHNLTVDQKALAAELEEPLLAHLRKRGLVAQTTSEDLEELLQKTKVGLYCGADPTARSLHLGNLLPLMILLHFNVRGHDVTGLVGGATGAVGDPSGRTTERTAMEEQTRLNNVEKIKAQMKGFFVSGVRYVKSISTQNIIEEGKIESRNNFEWWKDMTLLEFLATYGRHIRVSQMLARDSVKGRLESENGIGFNEFTYQILQAYDFWYLFRNHNVSIQVGGNDQWGNITAGVDLITRLKGVLNQDKKDKEAQRIAGRASFGLTVPLLTTASGEKFGKSAGNAVFIDSEITPSFDLYQYFIKTPDSEVEKLLKIFTFLPLSQIESIMSMHNQDPAYRNAQRVLANEVTDLIHGVGSGKHAAVVSSILYPLPDQPYPDTSSEMLINSFEKANILKTVDGEKFLDQPFSALVAELHGCSKKEAKKFVSNGAVYIGYDRLRVDPSDSVLFSRDQLIDGKLLLMRIGKSTYHVAQVL